MAYVGILLLTLLLMTAGTLLHLLVTRMMLAEKRKLVFIGLSVIPNTGLICLPIVQVAYGNTGVLNLSAYIGVFNIVLWALYP